jgi:hypothetical protein
MSLLPTDLQCPLTVCNLKEHCLYQQRAQAGTQGTQPLFHPLHSPEPQTHLVTLDTQG